MIISLFMPPAPVRRGQPTWSAVDARPPSIGRQADAAPREDDDEQLQTSLRSQNSMESRERRVPAFGIQRFCFDVPRFRVLTSNF
jgi:hypothetical protein